MAALSRGLRRGPQCRGSDRPARTSVQLGRPARDPFRPNLSQRPCLQLPAGRRRRLPRPERLHGAALQIRFRRARIADQRRDHRQHPCRHAAGMAPALARLSPARRTAAADAQPQAARARRARPAGDRDQSDPTALDRLVCGGGLAGDGLPPGAIDPPRGSGLAEAIAEHEIAPQVAYHRANARQVERLDHRLGQVGFVALRGDAPGLSRDPRRARPRRQFGQHLRQLVHAGFGGLSGARHRRLRHSLPGRLRRRRPALAGDRATRSSRSKRELRETSLCRAPPTSPSKRRGSCSPTSTSGGWSTSSATCRSATALHELDDGLDQRRDRRAGWGRRKSRGSPPGRRRRLLQHMVHVIEDGPICEFGWPRASRVGIRRATPEYPCRPAGSSIGTFDVRRKPAPDPAPACPSNRAGPGCEQRLQRRGDGSSNIDRLAGLQRFQRCRRLRDIGRIGRIGDRAAREGHRRACGRAGKEDRPAQAFAASGPPRARPVAPSLWPSSQTHLAPVCLRSARAH